MKIVGKRFADSRIDYGHPANFAIVIIGWLQGEI
jgi:hypothetical protein